ncbi:MAG: fibronectin type III domain-containing protein [Elusimicrobiota bacterium]
MSIQRAIFAFCIAAVCVVAVGCHGLRGPKTASITLLWDAAAPGTAAGYYVYYRTEGQAFDASRKIDAGDKPKLTIPDLKRHTKYYFQITAYNQAGESAPSNETSATAL